MPRAWWFALFPVVLPSALLAQAASDSLPAGVTAAMVQEGKRLYAAAGLCFACHGPEAKGVQGMGADLTDSQWVHSDGSFDGILRTATQGVTAEKSTNGVVMPPKGGSQLTDAQLRAVAAYVWSLSRPKGK